MSPSTSGFHRLNLESAAGWMRAPDQSQGPVTDRCKLRVPSTDAGAAEAEAPCWSLSNSTVDACVDLVVKAHAPDSTLDATRSLHQFDHLSWPMS